jgi:hypothetical protein
LFGGNGGLLGFAIGNPKYLGGPSGLGGFEPVFRGSNGLIKTLFTFLGISLCKFTNFIPLGVCGMDLATSIVWTCADTNEDSITIIIY